MSDANLLEPIAELFAPLTLAFEDVAYLQLLLHDVGWDVELLAEHLLAFKKLLPIVEQLATLERSGEDGVDAGDVVTVIVKGIQALATVRAADLTKFPAELAEPAFWGDLALHLPNYLLVTWLRDFHPVTSALLVLGGAIVEEPRDGSRPPWRRVDWPSVGALIANPPKQFSATWNFGGALDHQGLLAALAELGAALGWKTMRPPRSPAVDVALGASAPSDPASALEVEVLEGATSDGAGWGRFAVALVGAASPSDPTVSAIALLPIVTGSTSVNLDLGDGWSVRASAEGEAVGGLGLILRPDGVDVAGSGATLDFRIEARGEPEAPWMLIGSKEGSHLQVDHFAVSAGLHLGPKMELTIAIDAKDAVRIAIRPGEGDSFLSKMLGSIDLEIGGGFAADWSSATGWSFSGGVGFDVVIPIGKRIGPLSVQSIALSAYAGDAGLESEATVTGALELGPFVGTVEGIGVRLLATPRSDRSFGDLGPLDVRAKFRPPTGVGLSIDGGAVKGGGFLSLDPDAGRYAGILELETPVFGLVAIGLLNTKLPDNPKGWALFFALSATFTPSIQLGYGFALSGVGGVFAANRRLDDVAMSLAVRAGTLDRVLFPKDVVREAPAIFATIESLFPISEGNFVFGPMVKLSWGGQMVEVMLGVFVSLPHPLIIAILGRIRLALPDPAAPVILLNLDVAGIINFGAGTVAIDASLHDSTLLGKFELTGDMAFRAAFKDDPGFLFSVGGFHPAFQPPASIGTLKRMGMSFDLGKAKNVHISFGSYFALTPNTLQFGARFEVVASIAAFSLSGGAAFNALFVFEPFHFVADIGAWFSVSWKTFDILSVSVALELQGPTPTWRARGTATVEILGIEKSVSFDETFGDNPQKAVLSHPRAQLVAALDDRANWEELRPTSSTVRLRDASSEEDALWLQPDARLAFRQRAVPLKTTLLQLGHVPVDDPGPFTVSLTLGGEPPEMEDLEERFSPATIRKMTDAQKLSAPAFERMTGGVVAEGERVTPAAVEGDEPWHNFGGLWDQISDTTATGKAASLTARARPKTTLWMAPARVAPLKVERPRFASAPAAELSSADGDGLPWHEAVLRTSTERPRLLPVHALREKH